MPFEQFFYLFALLISLGGLAVCDWRWKLAFFSDARKAALVLTIGVAVFLIWDLLGIAFGIFFIGNSPYDLGVEVLPELPLEELLFLILLCYVSLLIYRGSEKYA